MTKLLLIGGGGHCKVVIGQLKATHKYEIAGIVDNQKPKGTELFGFPVIGTDNDLSLLRRQGISKALVTVGSIKDNSHRRKLFEMAKNAGFEMPALVSPSAQVDEDVRIGDGTVIMPGCILNAGASIGENCIINSGSIVEHDSKVGNHCHLCPGVSLSGSTNIGDLTFVGTGATIIHGLNIGKNTTIGAGSVVIKDLPDGVIAVGNPARVIKNKHE